MKSFASDNYSGICPEVMAAIQAVNHDHVPSYGNDAYTEKALTLLKQTFGDHAIPYLVYNGTAANALGLSAITRSHQAIICADSAHIASQEVGAVTSIAGCPMMTAPHVDGKLTPQAIENVYLNATYWGKHNNLPTVVSIAQTTEFGTVYSLEELHAISTMCKKHNLLFHMDGCRLSNAAISLKAELKAISADVGVDVLSFGGTKNGLLFGEAVIFFKPELAKEFDYIQKQTLQLHSKMRFLSAQFIPYLENKIWRRNAQHANDMCTRLAEGLTKISGIKFAYPVQSNQLFAYFPQAVIDATQKAFPYYVWDKKTNLCRLVTSFDTSNDEVDKFLTIASKPI